MTNDKAQRNHGERLEGEWPMYGHDVRRTGHAETKIALTAAPQESWQFDATGEINAPPVVGDGTVFIGTTAGEVYALDATTGECLWQQSLDGWIRTSPVVGPKSLFVGCGDSRIYAFNRKTGKEQWRKDTKAGITTSPLRLDDLLIGANRSGQVFAIDIRSGKLQWDYETTSGISVPIAAENTTVTAVSDNGVAYILDSYDGAERDTKQVGTGDPIMKDSGRIQFIGGNRIHQDNQSADASTKCASKGRLGFRNVRGGVGEVADSSTSWCIKVGDHSTKPVVIENTLLVSGSGTLYALDIETGLPRWRFEMGDCNLTSPVVASGWIYIGSEDGNVYGLTDASESSASSSGSNKIVVEHCPHCEADLSSYDTENFCPVCGSETESGSESRVTKVYDE